MTLSTTVDLPPLIQRWVHTYNTGDLAGHIELYTDDASIVVIGGAQTQVDLNPNHDKVVFWEVESALDAAAPRRQLRIDWAAVDEPRVCVEATLIMDPDLRATDQPISVHFTMDSGGTRLIRDRTYVDSALLAPPPADTADEQPDPEQVVRGYFSGNGPTHADFVADTRRWLAPDVVWIDRSNPEGVRGLQAVVAELERARSVGVEYMSFEIHDLVVVGDTVLTRRNDRLHGPDGGVLAELDMMGYNRVVDGKIVYGKDYHFETAAYDETWGAEGG